MLTIRQNLLETIRGGKPDRYVNQYEFIKLLYRNPFFDYHNGTPLAPGVHEVQDGWGIYWDWPADLPGEFPMHDDAHVVLKDVTEWKEKVHAPEIGYTDEEWAPYVEEANAIDRSQYYVGACMMPGIFEMCHHLMGIENALCSFYEEPEAMHELIDYLTDFECRYAEEVCKHIHPDALFHHDDWGSQRSTFISPEMFEEFILPAYKKIYGKWKELGVELIVHHSDSYAATLVPYMIEMGIDIWQGVMTTNNIPELIKEYGPKITFMGGVDSAKVDYPGWTRDVIRKEVRRACDENGKLYFIPNASQGLDISTFEGVYEALSEEIDIYSKEMF